MRKRFLSALLAACMLLTMLPTVAFAAPGNGTTSGVDIDEEGDLPLDNTYANIQYYLYTTQLYKLLMLADSKADATTEINEVNLLLTQNHSIVGGELALERFHNESSDEGDYYYSVARTNFDNTLNPDNIRGLTLSYTYNDNTSGFAFIQPEDLRIKCDNGEAGATADHYISSSNDDRVIVALYDEGPSYSLYKTYIINKDTSLHTAGYGLDEPSYSGYTFANWDRYKTGGAPFVSTSKVSVDTEVYSQRVSLDGAHYGTEFHIMNRENELKQGFVDVYNTRADVTQIAISDIDFSNAKITVYQLNDDTVYTNPDYDAGVLKNGWVEEGDKEDAFYRVLNFDADVEEGNTHVNPIEVGKIEVTAKSAETGEDITVLFNIGNQVGDIAFSITGYTYCEIFILREEDLCTTDPTEYEITGITKRIVREGETLAGIQIPSNVYLPSADTNMIVIDKEESTTLLYEITITGVEDATFSFTDDGATLVNLSSGLNDVTQNGDTFTGTIPASGKVVAYVMKTFTEPDANGMLTNTVVVEGTNGDEEDPNHNESTAGIEAVKEYQIIYHGNGGTTDKGKDSTSSTFNYGSEATLKNASTFTRKGFTFQGWANSADAAQAEYEGSQKIIFNESTFPDLKTDGKAELWAVWTKDAPTEQEVMASINGSGLPAVQVICDSDSAHEPMIYPELWENEDGKTRFEIGKVQYNNGQYTCPITIRSEVYVARYSEDIDAAHTKISTQQPQVVTLTWNDATAEWQVPDVSNWNKDAWAVFHVICLPDKPTDDELLGGDGTGGILPAADAIDLDCVNTEEDHPTKVFGLRKNEGETIRYTIGDPVLNEDNSITCTVTVNGQLYLATYDAQEFVGQDIQHQLTGKQQDTVVLTWEQTGETLDDGQWVAPEYVNDAPYIHFYATCDDGSTGGAYKVSVNKTLTKVERDGAEITVTDGMNLYPGDKLTWTITVKNNDTVEAAENLKLTDALKAGDTVITPGAVVIAPDGIDDENFTVAAGGEVKFTATYTVADSDVGKTLTNTATVSDVTSGGDEDPDQPGGGDEDPDQPGGGDEDPDQPGGGDQDPDQPGGDEPSGPSGSTSNPVVDPDSGTTGGGTGGSSGGGSSSSSNRYTLTYDSNGGTKYDAERYDRNTVVDLDKVPTREGYTFTGWYADDDLTDRITEIKMTSNKTVYAGWEQTEVPEWLNGDDHFAYIIGRSDGLIHPQSNITRAEVATIFFRLLKDDVREQYMTERNSFTDVTAGAWYNTAISTMADMDILEGDPNGAFRPDDNITRAEFAAIAARFGSSDYHGADLFTDIANHWARDEINSAANRGWVNGYEDGTYGPQQDITRAEAMTLVNRVLKRLPETADDLLDGMKVWPDNTNEHAWFYLAVQEATNSHDFERKDDEVHETWIELTADPDWTQYQ